MRDVTARAENRQHHGDYLHGRHHQIAPEQRAFELFRFGLQALYPFDFAFQTRNPILKNIAAHFSPPFRANKPALIAEAIRKSFAHHQLWEQAGVEEAKVTAMQWASSGSSLAPH
jgi:hypothetical protein